MAKNALLVYIVCHDEASEKEAQNVADKMYPGVSKIVRVSDSSKYFENQIFQYMAANRSQWQEVDYVGVCPYSWLSKTNALIQNVAETIAADGGVTDVFPFLGLKFIKKKFEKEMPYIEAITHQHGPFMLHAMMTMLQTYGGYNAKQILDKDIQGFFLNHWIAKREWMEKYVNFYIMAKVLAETSSLKEVLHENSWYTGRFNDTPEKLLVIAGKPYYTLHPFLFERMPAVFFHVEGAKVKNIGYWAAYTFYD